MKDFDKSIMKTCHILQGIKQKESDCLNEFVKCGPLIEWLKESMSDCK